MDQGIGTLKGLDGISSKEHLSMLGLSSLEKRILKGDLSALYSFLKRGGREGAAVLFSLGSGDRNASKLHQRNFGLNNKKHNFTERVVKHRTSREVFYSSTLPALKRHLDSTLNAMH